MNIGLRPIARNVYKANMTVVMKRPSKTGWLHFVVYYQSSANIYRKYLIDLWEGACGFLNGKAAAPVFQLYYENAKNLKMVFNFPLKCPIGGTLNAMHPGINASDI